MALSMHRQSWCPKQVRDIAVTGSTTVDLWNKRLDACCLCLIAI